MAQTINRKVAQLLAVKLEEPGVSPLQAIRLAKWIAVFQGLSDGKDADDKIEAPVKTALENLDTK